MFYQIARILCWLPLSILHPTKIYGKENIPKGKAILSCNHRSNWDIVLWLLHTKRRNKILAKKELFQKKFLGKILHYLGGIEIDRNGNDISAIKNCIRALKEENLLFIFPEGTRLHDESQILGEIKSGMAMIAIRTKTPIIPIWIERKPKIFRLSRYFIGKPFELSDFYDKKLDEQTLEKANQVVREKMLEVREQNLKVSKKKTKKQIK